MKLNRSLRTLFALSLIVLGFQPALADQIQDFLDQPVSTKASGAKFTIPEIQALIIKACAARKWVARVTEPGKLTASILVRGTHYAEISIPFTESTYSILYVASRELGADPKKRKIHRNYNKWVATLNYEISRTIASAL